MFFVENISFDSDKNSEMPVLKFKPFIFLSGPGTTIRLAGQVSGRIGPGQTCCVTLAGRSGSGACVAPQSGRSGPNVLDIAAICIFIGYLKAMVAH